MDSDKQVVSIGLDFEAREFMQFLEEQVVASYREGYAAGQKVEQEKRRAAWSKVREGAIGLLWTAILSFAVVVFLWWVKR